MIKKSTNKKRIKYNFQLLFVALLVLVLISPLFEKSLLGAFALDIITFMVLFIAMFSIRKSRLFHVVLFLFVINTVADIISYIYPHETILIVTCITSSIFLMIIALKIIYVVIKQETIKTDTVMGGLCGYVLLAYIWTMFYMILELLQPGSFNFTVHAAHSKLLNIYSLLNYYSLVTILSDGFGDIIPMSKWAQTMTVVEGLIGQFYIVFFISTLIGMYISDRSSKKNKKE